MAIQFARLQYVKRSQGQSACHKAAYNGREKIHDLRQEKTFDYSGREKCAYHAVVLPDGASEKYSDTEELWNTIEAVEVRCDAQVAKEMVLALPDDENVTLDDKIALTRGFLNKHFVDEGIICQIDIHAPHNAEKEGHNWHAHVLMPMRRCKDELFSLKARDLDVDMRNGKVVGTDKQWGVIWADYQNAYFKENGIDLVVDPIGIVPEIHLGPVRMRKKESLFVEENEGLQEKNKRVAQDERLVLQQLLKHESQFEKADVERFVEKHVLERDREDFLGRFWSSDELVLVGEDRYTSKAVLREEQKMMRMAERLSSKESFVTRPNYHIDLNADQKKVVDHVCAGPNLLCIEGRAGTGKSRVLCAIRETYEAETDTVVVRGLAPTSSVANAMQQEDGFTYAANIQKFLFSHYHGKEDIQYGKEVWLIDEASMVSNPVMGELLDTAWRYKAKVVLVGDEKQLSSIGRGGAFTACTKRFGSVSLENIVRQKNDDYRAIVEKIAEGKTKEALFDMAEMGTWSHYGTENEAVKEMMKSWYDDYKKDPYASFMVLEYRNQYVKEFNNHIHLVLKARGEVGPEEIMVKTARYGFAAFGTGDSLIFRENSSELGVHNGQRGVLIDAKENRFVVRVDDEKNITFDPETYTDFQHGYAGTIHSSQGLTFDRVYVLHSNHIDHNLFYVANSRHRLSCQYFSYGDRDRVYQHVATGSYKELCSEMVNEEPKSWLHNAVISLKNYMCKNHEFYHNQHSHYQERGLLITSYKEEERLQGYRTLYREDQEHWTNLEGQNIRMTTKQRDLEPFLREQGVGQCVLLDANRSESQLIGPYDRFHSFYQQHRADFCAHSISETQLRIRLFALEKRLNESPQSSQEMVHSRAYETLLRHETTLKHELLKDYDEPMTIQILYHLERTGDHPSRHELHRIQQRVTTATQQWNVYQTDRIFEASLPQEAQKQIQFQRQRERQMEM